MKAVPIHKAKANLSKYIAEAKKGKPVYIGSFGNAEVVLTAIPKKRINLGVWASKYRPGAYKDEDIIAPDLDIVADFENAVNKPL